jgi:hypothetical protein
MKPLIAIGIATVAIASSSMIASAHGPGHIHRNASQEVNQALDTGGILPDAQIPSPQARATSNVGKSFKESPIAIPEKIWGASLTTGWESRHIHYGVNETGNGGAYTTEVGLWVDNFTFNVWSGFGTSNDFQEWDFTFAYTIEAGPIFFIPGYNFRYVPNEEEAGHEEHTDHGGHEEHAHLVYNNELFAVIGTNKIPYVTPSAAFIWNLNDTPGAFLEFRIDGEVPVYQDIITLRPYILLGLNLGYNTTEYYGWNNFQFGMQADWQINKVISAFAGINYSIAMEALRDMEQGNEVWANVGLRFGF